MKRSLLAVLLIFLLAITLLAGCGTQKNQNANNENAPGGQAAAPSAQNNQKYRTIRSENQFLNTYRGWTDRLNGYGDRADAAYTDWVNGKGDVNVYLEKLIAIRKDMDTFNKETDLWTDFKLSDAGKKRVQYEKVTTTFARASATLYNYLYDAPRTPDAKLKTEYQQKVRGQYKGYMKEMNSLLE